MASFNDVFGEGSTGPSKGGLPDPPSKDDLKNWRAAAKAYSQAAKSLQELGVAYSYLGDVHKKHNGLAMKFVENLASQAKQLKDLDKHTRGLAKVSEEYVDRLVETKKAAEEAADAEEKLTNVKKKKKKVDDEVRRDEDRQDKKRKKKLELEEVTLKDFWRKARAQAGLFKSISTRMREIQTARGENASAIFDTRMVGPMDRAVMEHEARSHTLVSRGRDFIQNMRDRVRAMKEVVAAQQKGTKSVKDLFTGELRLTKQSGLLARAGAAVSGALKGVVTRIAPAGALALAASEAWNAYKRTLEMTAKAAERIVNTNARLISSQDAANKSMSQATKITIGVADETLSVAEAQRAVNRAAHLAQVDRDQLMAGMSTIASETGAKWAELRDIAEDVAWVIKKTGLSAEQATGTITALMRSQGMSARDAVMELDQLNGIVVAGAMRQADEFRKRELERAKLLGEGSDQYIERIEQIEKQADRLRGVFQNDFFNVINQLRESTEVFHGSLKEVGLLFEMVRKRASDAGRSYEMTVKQAAGVTKALTTGLNEDVLVAYLPRYLKALSQQRSRLTAEEQKNLDAILSSKSVGTVKAQAIRESGLLMSEAGMRTTFSLLKSMGGAQSAEMLQALTEVSGLSAIALQELLRDESEDTFVAKMREANKGTAEGMQTAQARAEAIAERQRGILETISGNVQDIRDGLLVGMAAKRARAAAGSRIKEELYESVAKREEGEKFVRELERRLETVSDAGERNSIRQEIEKKKAEIADLPTAAEAAAKLKEENAKLDKRYGKSLTSFSVGGVQGNFHFLENLVGGLVPDLHRKKTVLDDPSVRAGIVAARSSAAGRGTRTQTVNTSAGISEVKARVHPGNRTDPRPRISLDLDLNVIKIPSSERNEPYSK